MTLADAWDSSDVIIWDGLTPYLFMSDVCPDVISNVVLNLFSMEICYGSSDCYINIQTINPIYLPSQF
jgi:hypothetical protein